MCPVLKHYAMKTCGILVILDRGEWPASRPGRFTLGVKAPVTFRIGSWMIPRAGLDAVVKRKILSLAGKQTPAVYPITRHYTD
jgi:hypothetical protein